MKVKKILSIVLCITMVLTMIQCMGTKKAYAVTDNEGPLITNITVTPCVANPGDTIIISARIVDESGVAEGSNNSVTAFIKTEGGVTVTRDIRLARKNGDIYDGVYECEYRIPTGYSAGNWYARIMACDIYGNDETEMPKVDFRVTDTTLIQSISRLELNLRNGISLDAFKTVLNDTHSINVGFTDCTSRIYIVKSAVSGNTIYDDFVEKYGAYDPSNRNAQNYTLTGVIDLEGLHGYNEQNVEIEINIAAASGGGGGGGGSTTKKVTSIEAVNIQIKNGTQVDEFKNNLKDRYTVLVKFSDNSSAVVPVSPGFDSMGNQYGSFYEQFIATYGEKKYNPQNRKAQKYTITGNVDLTNYNCDKRNAVTITIQVSAGATISSIGDVIIEIKAGSTIEELKAILNDKYNVNVKFSDGSVEMVPLEPGYGYSRWQYASLYEQFAETFTDENGYSPESLEEKSFELKGVADVTIFGESNKQEVKVIINVVKKDVTVIFDGNGGIYTGPHSKTVKMGNKYDFDYDASWFAKEGYLFDGWYTEAEGGTRVWSGMKCMEDITLYARWKKVFTGKVKNVDLKSWSKNRLTVKWEKPVSQVNGYEIAISTDKKKWTSSICNGKIVKYYTGLKSGRKYYVKVRAYRYDSVGNKVYGAWSTIKSCKVK